MNHGSEPLPLLSTMRFAYSLVVDTRTQGPAYPKRGPFVTVGTNARQQVFACIAGRRRISSSPVAGKAHLTYLAPVSGALFNGRGTTMRPEVLVFVIGGVSPLYRPPRTQHLKPTGPRTGDGAFLILSSIECASHRRQQLRALLPSRTGLFIRGSGVRATKGSMRAEAEPKCPTGIRSTEAGSVSSPESGIARKAFIRASPSPAQPDAGVSAKTMSGRSSLQ
jgi:hypothetical protein